MAKGNPPGTPEEVLGHYLEDLGMMFNAVEHPDPVVQTAAFFDYVREASDLDVATMREGFLLFARTVAERQRALN